MDRASRVSGLVIISGGLLVSCSGDNVSGRGAADGGASGASATGGTAEHGGGAGGARGSRAAQGNASLSIQPSSLGQAQCPVSGRTYVIGNPQGPNSTQPGDRLIDGENGAAIQCSVRGRGPFTFSGSIQATDRGGDTVTIAISNGVIDQDEQTGTATASVLTPQLGSAFSSAEAACTVLVVADNVKAGSLWATFSCLSVAAASTAQVCAIGATSTVVLENCDGA